MKSNKVINRNINMYNLNKIKKIKNWIFTFGKIEIQKFQEKKSATSKISQIGKTNYTSKNVL